MALVRLRILILKNHAQKTERWINFQRWKYVVKIRAHVKCSCDFRHFTGVLINTVLKPT